MKINKLLAGTATIFLALPCSAMAAGGLSYNYLEVGYIDIDFDDTDVDADGGFIGGSALLSEQVFGFGSYSSVESDSFTLFGVTGSIELDQLTAGLGFRHALQRNKTDFNAGVAFIRQDIEGQGGFSGAEDDDNGHGFALGIRHLFTQQFEVNIGATYVDIFDDDDTALGIAGLLHFNRQLTAKAEYSTGSDTESITIGLRLNF